MNARDRASEMLREDGLPDFLNRLLNPEDNPMMRIVTNAGRDQGTPISVINRSIAREPVSSPELQQRALRISCPKCLAPADVWCRGGSEAKKLPELHSARRIAAKTEPVPPADPKEKPVTQPNQAEKPRKSPKSRAAPGKPADGSTKKMAGEKTASAKARTPAAQKPPSGTAKGVRPGSKLEIVVDLLTRRKGCTAAEILAACNWPAVSVPQQARAAGLTLRQEKEGKVTRYWGTAS